MSFIKHGKGKDMQLFFLKKVMQKCIIHVKKHDFKINNSISFCKKSCCVIHPSTGLVGTFVFQLKQRIMKVEG